MRQFYLAKNSSGYYRAIFLNPETGVPVSTKSTHSKDKFEATMIATSWLQNGVPKARGNERAFSVQPNKTPLNLNSVVERVSKDEAIVLMNLLSAKFGLAVSVAGAGGGAFAGANVDKSKTEQTEKAVEDSVLTNAKPKIKLIEYLLNFWDYDNSEYIKRYLPHGKGLGRKHAAVITCGIKRHWQPYFGDDVCVDELDRKKLDDFFFYLYNTKGLKGGTVNKMISAGNRAFSYLLSNGKIDSNPMDGIERFSPNAEKRGIPTESEVKALLGLEWKNEANKLAFKLGAFCGLRAGEISGLRVCDLDLDEDFIHIRHSWSDADGLKCPKNTDIRSLPAEHELLMELTAQARRNPNFSDMSFVFFSSVKPEQPYCPDYYADGFYEALAEIGVGEEERKDRNIVFHSLRHFCATVLSQRADIKTVQAIMGHRTEDMTKHYSDHETQEKMDNMKRIMHLAWSNLKSA